MKPVNLGLDPISKTEPGTRTQTQTTTVNIEVNADTNCTIPKTQYNFEGFQFLPLEQVNQDERRGGGGNWDIKILQKESKWIFKLNSTSPPVSMTEIFPMGHSYNYIDQLVFSRVGSIYIIMLEKGEFF